MAFGKKIAMGVLAGVTVLAMTMPQAEARNGHNAALLGGLFLGAVAGAALASSADDNGDGDAYQRNDYDQPRYSYRYQSYQSYDDTPAYRVRPRYSSGYGDDGCEHPRRYHQRAYYGEDDSDGY